MFCLLLPIQMQSSFHHCWVWKIMLLWPCWELDFQPIGIFSKETWLERGANCKIFSSGESCEQQQEQGVSQQGGSNFFFIPPLKINLFENQSRWTPSLLSIILVEHSPCWTSLTKHPRWTSFPLLALTNKPIRQKELLVHLSFEHHPYLPSSLIIILVEHFRWTSSSFGRLYFWIGTQFAGSDVGQLDYSSLSCAPYDIRFNCSEKRRTIQSRFFRSFNRLSLMFFFSIKGKGCQGKGRLIRCASASEPLCRPQAQLSGCCPADHLNFGRRPWQSGTKIKENATNGQR